MARELKSNVRRSIVFIYADFIIPEPRSDIQRVYKG